MSLKCGGALFCGVSVIGCAKTNRIAMCTIEKESEGEYIRGRKGKEKSGTKVRNCNHKRMTVSELV